MSVGVGLANVLGSDKASVDLSSIVPHPDFRRDGASTNEFDIALLEFKRALSLESYKVTFELAASTKKLNVINARTLQVRPICLPTNIAEDFVGSMATISGWGGLFAGGPQSHGALREKDDLVVLGNADCAAAFAHLVGGNFTITDSMICAHSIDADTCQGDSGGSCFLYT